MFEGQYILAEVRAGNIAPKWLVIPANPGFLRRRFASSVLSTCLLEGLFFFAALGCLSFQLWLTGILSLLVGIGMLWWVYPPMRQAYRDLITWQQQFAIFTPEGFLIASSIAIKPRICLAYQDIQEMQVLGTTSSAGGEGITFSIKTSHLRVTYQDTSIKTFTLDHRFGPEERLWNICIAAHHWYVTHALDDDDASISNNSTPSTPRIGAARKSKRPRHSSRHKSITRKRRIARRPARMLYYDYLPAIVLFVVTAGFAVVLVLAAFNLNPIWGILIALASVLLGGNYLITIMKQERRLRQAQHWK